MPDRGPLSGIKVVELASIGPGPFAAMMLADHGADVIRIQKPGGRDVGLGNTGIDPMLRGRRNVALDLKNSDDVTKALNLIAKADVLIEGFRPSVTERIGLGPEQCHAVNPALVYGRMTGWGQDGPLAARAGHDINYIALTGALDAVGTPESGPVPPMNLVGDFGGGGMLLAYGICAALLPAKLSGKGTVIDAAMVEGAALLMTMPFALKAGGFWGNGRGENLLDGGAPFYGTYETADKKWMAIGAIEEPFWQELISKLKLDHAVLKRRMDPASWPEIQTLISDCFASKDQSYWVDLFDGSDGCVTAVLTMDEVSANSHIQARGVFVEKEGTIQPAPAPRYDGASMPINGVETGLQNYSELLDDWS